MDKADYPGIFLGVHDTRIKLSTIEHWAKAMREVHGDILVMIAAGDPHNDRENFGGLLPNEVFVAHNTDDELCAWLIHNPNERVAGHGSYSDGDCGHFQLTDRCAGQPS